MGLKGVTPIPWSDEEIAFMNDCVERGWTGSMIARAISERWPEKPRSRNAIIGKVHRLGEKKLKTAIGVHTPGGAKKGRPRKPYGSHHGKAFKRVGNKIMAASANPKQPTQPLPKTKIEAPEPLHLSFADNEGCNFAFGNGPYTFCGHPKAAGKSYCAAHSGGVARASEPPKSKLAPMHDAKRRRGRWQ